MPSCNLLKVSQKDQDLVRSLFIPAQYLTLMIATRFFRNKPRMLCRTREWTSWNPLRPAAAAWGTLQWLPPELSSLCPLYNTKISTEGQRFSTIFEHGMCVCIAMFPMCTLECPHLCMQWQRLSWCLCMSPSNEDGLDAFCGDVLLWEPSSVCPSLLVLNKVPSHKITSELPFGWQLLSIWVLWSSNTSRTKQILSKCFTIKMIWKKCDF